jgi:hypothetical protein
MVDLMCNSQVIADGAFRSCRIHMSIDRAIRSSTAVPGISSTHFAMVSNTEMLSRVNLDHKKNVGVVHSEVLSKTSAETASDLLTKNHEIFHAYFHIAGMHSKSPHPNLSSGLTLSNRP